jgi:hypothetical protein
MERIVLFISAILPRELQFNTRFSLGLSSENPLEARLA